MSSLHKAIDTTLAAEAVKIVTQDRQAAYDHPENNFARIAQVWNATLQAGHGQDFGLTPRDVALMMVGLKLVRESYHHKRDNLVDLIGYALTADAVTPGKGKVESELDKVRIPVAESSFSTHPAAQSFVVREVTTGSSLPFPQTPIRR